MRTVEEVIEYLEKIRCPEEHIVYTIERQDNVTVYGFGHGRPLKNILFTEFGEYVGVFPGRPTGKIRLDKCINWLKSLPRQQYCK